jgi:hypothetical protein
MWKSPVNQDEASEMNAAEISEHVGESVRVLTQTSPTTWGGFGSQSLRPENYAASIRSLWTKRLTPEQQKVLIERIRSIKPAAEAVYNSVKILLEEQPK